VNGAANLILRHATVSFFPSPLRISPSEEISNRQSRISRLRTVVNEGKARETVSNRPKRGNTMSILKKLREQTRPLGVKEIADLFDVTESTIQRWVRRGDIPAIRVNDTIRCDPQILADFIELASAASQHSRDFRYRLAQEPEESGEPLATDSQEGKR
jgi:excisionase family DNA binding protein